MVLIILVALAIGALLTAFHYDQQIERARAVGVILGDPPKIKKKWVRGRAVGFIVANMLVVGIIHDLAFIVLRYFGVL